MEVRRDDAVEVNARCKRWWTSRNHRLTAVFEVRGLDKLWAFRSRLEIPLAHIRHVRIDPEAARGWFHGLRLPGTSLPGVLTAGTFYLDGKRVFWDVHHPDQTIVVELQDNRFRPSSS